ncbi:MAG: Ig-like domain-containing protein [Lachnospiraceae bacterium]|nr:Ig-like domain-containing protein [Lachnospiraceae bacterium]
MDKEQKMLLKRLIGIIAAFVAGLIVAVIPMNGGVVGNVIYARADETATGEEDETAAENAEENADDESAKDADGETEKESDKTPEEDSGKKDKKEKKDTKKDDKDSKKSAKPMLNETKLTLKVGDTFVLYVQNLVDGDKVSYKTSDKKVASVAASGLVSANKKGNAVITASVSHANGKSDSFKCKISIIGKKKDNGKFKDIADTAALESALASGKDGAYRLTGNSYTIKETQVIVGNVTIDFNGKNIIGNTTESLFQVGEGGSLTLVDNSNDGNCFLINKGYGGVADCFDGGTLTVDLRGDATTAGRHVFWSSGDFILKSGKFSGGENNIYIKAGTATIEGGEISGAKRGIVLENGELIIKKVKIDVTYSCLCANGGNMVIAGGELRNTAAKTNEGFTALVNGGVLQINGGTAESFTSSVNISKGKLFVNGGELKSLSENGYAVYAEDDQPGISVTVNGGTLGSKFIGIFFQNNPNSSLYVNGGTIETTGEVAITATGVPVAISGGKIKCDKTVCVIGSSDEEKTVKVTGGTFTGKECLVLNGKLATSIKGGTYKGSSYDLIISSSYDGKLKYDKSSFKKVLDQRKGGEKNSDSDPNGYRRIDVTYKENMLVEDVSTLYSLVCLSCEKLVPTMKLRMTKELFDVMEYYCNKSGNWLWIRDYMGYQETSTWKASYSYKVGNPIFDFTIHWDFGIEHQINSLAGDSSLYSKVDDSVKTYSDQIDEILDSIITKKMTDEEKVKAVHDYMCDNYEYANPIVENGPKSDHTFHAMLDDGTGVCQAYATLFHVMMLKLGIKDETVVGESSSTPWGAAREAHMWNRVMIGNEWLYVDVTWDDGGADDKYLLKTEKDFYSDATHFPEA